MILALDTNAVVELLRRRPNPVFRQRLDQARRDGHALHISSICLHELIYRALRSPHPAHHLDLVYEMAENLEVDPWTAEDAMTSARIRAQTADAGAPVGGLDVLIAAHALRCDGVLVTSNLRDFFRPGTLLDDLRLIDWSVSDQPFDRPTLVARLRRIQED